MKNTNKSRIKFDVQFLENLLSDKKSCVEKIRREQHLALHPFHLNYIKESIQDLLNKKIGKFIDELDGILFGYSNILLISPHGKILNDSCFIHVDIEADFYVFKPIIGNILIGNVNKKSKDHVGCLVHKTFNVSVPKEEKAWLGDDIKLGSEVELMITFTNYKGLLPYIRGKLISIISEPEVEEIVETPQKKSPKKIKFDPDESQKPKKIKFTEDEDNNETIEESPMKRKKKKIKTEENVDETIENIKVEELSPKKKKSKKKKDKSILDDSAEILDNIAHMFDDKNVDNLLDNVIGKQKRQSLSIGDDLGESPKKKKRKHVE